MGVGVAVFIEIRLHEILKMFSFDFEENGEDVEDVC